MEGSVKLFEKQEPAEVETSAGGSSSVSSTSTVESIDSLLAIAKQDSVRSLNSTRRVKQIWAVGGGKGGVGKSLVASSLAIAVSRMGHKVIAVDLDLGGANLHTTLGVDLPRQTLGDVLNHRVSGIDSCVVPSGIPDLNLISGAQDSVGIANLQPSQKIELLKNMRNLDADYIIFDLGAGTGTNTLDFFLFSDIGLIVILPEPTSIENSYRFIKSVYYRFLTQSPSLSEIRPLIEMAMDPKNPLGIRSPADLFREVNKTNPEAGLKLKRQIERFRPKLIVNQARTQTDIDIGSSVRMVCKKYFGIDLDYLGHLDYDSFVWQAVRRKRPLMMEFPNSKVVSNLEQIAQIIVKRHSQQKSELLG
ncbi:MAG: P-loop NTPase [Bdellovibrio sp.]|nr:P-loop NTPase [Bdellovibrio sp.]